jgi:Crp-like helix-turn-helix domain
MSSLLQGLPEEERAAAAAAVGRCTTLTVPAGTARPAARVPESALLVVEEGVVMLTSARAGATRRMVIAVAGPGAALLPPVGDERIEGLLDSWLTVVGHDAYAALLALPAVAATLVQALTEELRERQESLGHFSSVRHVERVRGKLVQLARSHGKVVPGGVRLDLPLTHELLGEMVGSARETVTWAFAQLAREGFVSREGRFYRLAVSPELLAS